MLGFDHFIDQPGSRGEAYAALLPARGDGQAGQQMGLAGAAVADKNDRLRFGDVVALGQFMDLLGRNLGIAYEVELVEGLHARQTGFADTPLDQPLVAFLEFSLKQRFEEAEMGAPLTHRITIHRWPFHCSNQPPITDLSAVAI
jgi:hypothetical protein